MPRECVARDARAHELERVAIDVQREVGADCLPRCTAVARAEKAVHPDVDRPGIEARGENRRVPVAAEPSHVFAAFVLLRLLGRLRLDLLRLTRHEVEAFDARSAL